MVRIDLGLGKRIALGWICGWASCLAADPPAVAVTNRPPLPPMPPGMSLVQTSRPIVLPRVVPQPQPRRTSPPAAPAGRVTVPVVPKRVPAPVTATRREAQTVLPPFPLVFDSEIKELEVASGVTNTTIRYRLTNSSPAEVTVNMIRGSCGCTVAKMPSVPWKIAAGADGEFEVAVDLRGKHGLLHKMVYLFSSHGYKALQLKVKMPDPLASLDSSRVANIRIAAADRQAVFKHDCARCHSEPGQGKQGKELFEAVCGVCHAAEHRASMVPDLSTLTRLTGKEQWKFWISFGKANTLMPAFSQKLGGPLTDPQIESLANYLLERFPPKTNVMRRLPTE